MEEQISQAKELLQMSDLEKKEEAVRILIGISKQGNQEATTILAKCLAGGEGVTPENKDEVKWCIKTSEEEKRLQHVVEEIYNSMKKDGEDKVALQDISDALKKAEEKLKVRLKNVARSIILINIHSLYVPAAVSLLALINRAGGLYGRILTEVVSTDRTQ